MSPEVGGVNIVSHSQVMLDVFFVKYPRPHPVWWLVSVRLLLQATAQRIVNHLPEGHLALPGLLLERVRQIVIYR